MTTYIILAAIPVLSALIGWFTNFIAVRMLFRPRKRVSILGFKLQGLLPRRQEEIAVQVSETIEAEFFSTQDIVKTMESLEFEKDNEAFIDRVVDERLADLLEGIPLVGSFVTSGILSKLKKVFKAEIKDYKEQMVRDVAEQLGHAVDVKQMVYEKISDYDLDRLEKIVKRIASSELRHIELLGGVLGFIIGCIQVAVIVFSGVVQL